MKVLVIGNGGREHALCWKLKSSPSVTELYCAPGNPGIASVARCVPHTVREIDALVSFAKREQIDLTIVGPEEPLSLGIVDAFEKAEQRIFGPTAAAAQLESSKKFAKEIMIAAKVPTAAYESFTTKADALQYAAKKGVPLVIKADGLAAGKGVYVCLTTDEVKVGLDAVFDELKSTQVVIEQFLTGVEISCIFATDGERVVPLASAHDYKRIGDHDVGLNTGGMGTVSPSPRLDPGEYEGVIEQIITPVLREMQARGTPFSGFLYAGLMKSPEGKLYVIEFNARMGDPECQVIIPKLGVDLAGLLFALSEKTGVATLPNVSAGSGAAVCVVLASEGYPQAPKKGAVIHGLEHVQGIQDTVVFHAGTKMNERGEIEVYGGRVLGVTGFGATVEEARSRAYRCCDMIQFQGRQLRRDIGLN